MTHKSATNRSIVGIDEAHLDRFIGGRRRYNRMRAINARQRRLRVWRLVAAANLAERGWQAKIARELGVHRSTICRDIVAMGTEARQYRLAAAEQDYQQRLLFMNMLMRCEGPDHFPASKAR